MTFTRRRHPPSSSLDGPRLHPSASFTPGAFGRRETVSALDCAIAVAIESLVDPAAFVELLDALEPGKEDAAGTPDLKVRRSAKPEGSPRKP